MNDAISRSAGGAEKPTARVLAFPTFVKPAPRVFLWDGPGRPDEEALRRCLTDAGYQVVKWTSEPATGYPSHIHIYPELLWLIAGSLTVILSAEGRMIELAPGDRVELPRGLAHGTLAGADGAAYLVATK